MRLAVVLLAALAGWSAMGQVETIVVVGTRTSGAMYFELHRQISIDDYCYAIHHGQPWCPQHQGGVGGPGMPNYGGNNQPCGQQVTAHCKCTGNASQKVYDASSGDFHCKTPPPTAPCPGAWGTSFDYDPKQWKCAMTSFDANAKDAAKRIKDCVGSVISTNWSHIESIVSYGSSGGDWGSVACNNGITSDMELNRNLYQRRAGPHASHWQFMAHTLTHEARHVNDVAKSRTCEVWNDSAMRIILSASGYPATYRGYEDYTRDRTLRTYKAELGVRSPRDPDYDPATDGAVSCPLH